MNKKYTTSNSRTTLVSALLSSLLLVAASPAAVDYSDQQQPLSRALQDEFSLETCTPTTQSDFTIQLLNMGGNDIDSRYVAAFDVAAKRWQKVIVGDLQGFPAGATDDWFGGVFAPRTYSGAVDDLVIGYEVSPAWDGPGGTLGRAGTVLARTSRTGRTLSAISGIMQFDQDDFDLMSDDDIKIIITHEMGHILGLVGTVGSCTAGCNPNNAQQNGVYQCQGANAVFNRISNGNQLLLENRGGPGTACGHWEENSFRAGASSELMTGFFEENLFQPLSLVTVAALADIGGYEVDFCGADFWPADANTIQRFDIFQSGALNGTISIGDVDTTMGMDEDGNIVPLGDTGNSAGSRSILWAVAVISSLATLGLSF